jgi:hypothetical protein
VATVTGHDFCPPQLTSAGPARIRVVEPTGGGVSGAQGFKLTEAHGQEAARLHRRFDRMALAQVTAVCEPSAPAGGEPGDEARSKGTAWLGRRAPSLPQGRPLCC